jgi:hypothetical protein
MVCSRSGGNQSCSKGSRAASSNRAWLLAFKIDTLDDYIFWQSQIDVPNPDFGVDFTFEVGHRFVFYFVLNIWDLD